MRKDLCEPGQGKALLKYQHLSSDRLIAEETDDHDMLYDVAQSAMEIDLPEYR